MPTYLKPFKIYGIQWLIISCLLLHPLNLYAETDKTTTSQLATEEEISNEVLLERTRQALETATAVATRLESLITLEAELTAEIDKQIIQREALAIPEVETPATPPTQQEAAQALVKAWNERIEVLTQHQELLTTQQELAKKHRETVLKLAAEHRLLAEAIKQLTPFVEDIAKRQDAGDLEQAEVPEGLETIAKKYQPEQLITEADKWQASAARDSLMVEAITQQLTELTTQSEAASAAQQQANAWLEEANRRTEIAKEFEGRDFADLTALFATQLTEWKTTLEGVETQISVLGEKNTAFAEAKAAVEQLTPPNPSEFVIEDEPIASLKEARQNLLIAEATLTFRQARLEQLQALKSNLETLQTTTQTTVENTQKLFNTTIELDVLANVINAQHQAVPKQAVSEQTISEQATLEQAAPEQAMSEQVKSANTLPEAIKDKQVSAQLTVLRAQLSALKMSQATTATEAEALQKTLAQADAAIVDAEKNVETQQKQVERETEWATFISKARNLDTPALLEAFETSLTEFTEAKAQVDKGTQALVNSRTGYQQALEAFEAFRDPNLLDHIDRTDDFKKWYEAEGLRIPKINDAGASKSDNDQESGDQSTTETTAIVEETAQASEAEDSQQLEVKQLTTAEVTAQQLAETRRLRDQWVVRYVAALQEWQTLRDDLLNNMQASQQIIKVHLEKLETAFALARNNWGGATTLQTRSGNNEIAAENLPAAVKEWTSREQIVLLQTEITELQTELSEIEQSYETLRKAEGYGVFVAPFEVWKSNLDRQITQLSERLDLEKAYTPPDPEKMNEFEKQRYDRAVDERLQKDESWYELTVISIVSTQMEATNSLLRGYYEQLSKLEYQQANLGERQIHTEKLIELHEATREVFGELEAEFEKVFKDLDLQLDIYLAKLKAAFTPAESANILAELKEKTGVTVTTSELPELPSSADAEARAKAQQVLLTQLLERWAATEGYKDLVKKCSLSTG